MHLYCMDVVCTVCVRLQWYLHPHAYTHAHTYILLHTVYTQAHTMHSTYTACHYYTQVCTYTHTCTQTHMHTHTTQTCTHTRTHSDTHAHTHTPHTHTRMHTHTCTHTHAHTHTHTHTYAHTLFTHACTMDVSSACTHSLWQVGMLSQSDVVLSAFIIHLTMDTPPDSVYPSLHVMLAVLLMGTWPDGTALPLVMGNWWQSAVGMEGKRRQNKTGIFNAWDRDIM